MALKLKRTEIHACWFCIKTNITAEVADNAADDAFLMQLLSKVASKDIFDKGGDEELETEMDFDLEFKDLRGIWFCLRVIVENKMHQNRGQEGIILSAASKIAEELDGMDETVL